ncbi:MAG: hypothetical protein E6Q97_03920 [Desulfurellales bacterium]|nr:MAG: hypothetical protein E6Q97_03920 [Desulfurellales bacterium]
MTTPSAPPTADDVLGPDNRVVLSHIESNYELLRICVHCPQMQRQVDEATVTVGTTELESSGVSVSWQLLPPAVRQELQGVAAACRAIINSRSVPFASRRRGGVRENVVPGLYLVPRRAVPELVTRLREYETEMRAVFDRHAPDDQTLQALVRDHVGADAFTIVEQQLPSVASQRAKLRIDITAFTIASTPSAAVDAEQQAAQAAAVVRQAVLEPRERVADALARLVELIRRDGRVTNRSFAPVLAAIAAVDNFPDATDSVLRDALAALRTTLGNVVPAQQTCEIATATGLLAQLEHAANLCRAPDVAEARLATIRMGRAPRRAARRPDPVGATT